MSKRKPNNTSSGRFIMMRSALSLGDLMTQSEVMDLFDGRFLSVGTMTLITSKYLGKLEPLLRCENGRPLYLREDVDVFMSKMLAYESLRGERFGNDRPS